MSDKDDDTYNTQLQRTVGMMLANMFLGMVEKGLTRPEALEIIKSYAQGLAHKS